MPDICGSIEGVQSIVQSAGWRRIGIDGVDGAGKSRLAEELSEGLGFPILNVDDYLHRNQGGYVDFIDYPALCAALSSMPALILSGICLRQLLANLGTDLDAHIYIKRVRDGLWTDEDECIFPDGVDVAIDNLASNTAMISSHLDEPSDYSGPEPDDESLHVAFEVMRYHAAFSPHEVADLIYERGAM
jgi:hypothetical protein